MCLVRFYYDLNIKNFFNCLLNSFFNLSRIYPFILQAYHFQPLCVCHVLNKVACAFQSFIIENISDYRLGLLEQSTTPPALITATDLMTIAAANIGKSFVSGFYIAKLIVCEVPMIPLSFWLQIVLCPCLCVFTPLCSADSVTFPANFTFSILSRLYFICTADLSIEKLRECFCVECFNLIAKPLRCTIRIFSSEVIVIIQNQKTNFPCIYQKNCVDLVLRNSTFPNHPMRDNFIENYF